MPWSPIPKFPEVLREIKRRNPTGKFNRSTLEEVIMEVILVCREKTVRKTASLMLRLGYIREHDNGIFEINPEKLKGG